MKIILVLHDIRSLYNIGSLARTADGFGVSAIYATGLTPYTSSDDDIRPPHVRDRAKREIHKTALGAEESLPITHHSNILELIETFRSSGFAIVGIEQTEKSVPLPAYSPTSDVLLLLGSETTGLPAEVLRHLDVTVEIPMLGNKESFNVTIAAAIALYELRRDALY